MNLSEFKKKNGFSRPLHTYQVLSWFISFFNLSTTLSLILPQYKSSAFATILSIYLCLFALYTLLGFQVTHSDPSDPAILLYHSTNDLNLLHKLEESNERYCTICISPVDISSKHCMRCARCSLGFDHHCKWVNNCIAKSNYRLFILLICSVEVYHSFLVYIQISTLQSMIRISYDEKEEFYGYGKEYFYASFVGICVSLAFCLGVLVFDGFLIVFHVFLGVRGITTFQHNVIRSQKVLPDNHVGDKSITGLERNGGNEGEFLKIEGSERHDNTFVFKN